MQYVGAFETDRKTVYLIDEDTLEVEIISNSMFLDRLRSGIEYKDGTRRIREVGKCASLLSFHDIEKLSEIAGKVSNIELSFGDIYSHAYYSLGNKLLYTLNMTSTSWRSEYFNSRVLGDIKLSYGSRGVMLEYRDNVYLINTTPRQIGGIWLEDGDYYISSPVLKGIMRVEDLDLC